MIILYGMIHLPVMSVIYFKVEQEAIIWYLLDHEKMQVGINTSYHNTDSQAEH